MAWQWLARCSRGDGCNHLHSYKLQWSLQSGFVSLTCLSSQPNMTALWRTPTPSSARPSPITASSGLESASRRMELYAAKYPGKYFVFDCSEHTIADSIDTSPPASATVEDVKGERGISAVA